MPLMPRRSQLSREDVDAITRAMAGTDERLHDRFYVMRHSGRRGDMWRCVFITDDQDEALEEYSKRLPRRSISYAATIVVRGLWPGGHSVYWDGFDPTPGGSKEDWRALLDAEKAYVRRMHRAGKRNPGLDGIRLGGSVSGARIRGDLREVAVKLRIAVDGEEDAALEEAVLEEEHARSGS
ncbi:MAG: hypothetical protein ACTHU0_21945 [Kofleriaceae bacterium]